MNPIFTGISIGNSTRSDTMVDAHNKGKKARADGVERLQVLQNNPYRIMDDRWDAFNAGWEGEPCPDVRSPSH